MNSRLGRRQSSRNLISSVRELLFYFMSGVWSRPFYPTEYSGARSSSEQPFPREACQCTFQARVWGGGGVLCCVIVLQKKPWTFLLYASLDQTNNCKLTLIAIFCSFNYHYFFPYFEIFKFYMLMFSLGHILADFPNSFSFHFVMIKLLASQLIYIVQN